MRVRIGKHKLYSMMVLYCSLFIYGYQVQGAVGHGVEGSPELGIVAEDSINRWVDCSNPVQLICGQPYSDNTSPGVSNVTFYACTGWNESGYERVHKISFTQTMYLTAYLSGMTADLDLFLLQTCNESTCLAFGDEGLAAVVNAGDYYLVVDGFSGNFGPYTLLAECATLTPTMTPTVTPTMTPTSSPTLTPSITATNTLTRTPTTTATPSPTLTPTRTQTFTASPSMTSTPFFSVLIVVIPSSTNVLLGDAIDVTVHIINNSVGCIFPVHDLTLSQVGPTPIFTPVSSVVGPPVNEYTTFHVVSNATGTVNFRAAAYGERYCNDFWQWMTIYGTSVPVTVYTTSPTATPPPTLTSTPPVSPTFTSTATSLLTETSTPTHTATPTAPQTPSQTSTSTASPTPLPIPALSNVGFALLAMILAGMVGIFARTKR